MIYILDDVYPERPNITYDFSYGEGLGFGVIREHYESKEITKYKKDIYFVSYNNNSKHNENKVDFGDFSVSPGWNLETSDQ